MIKICKSPCVSYSVMTSQFTYNILTCRYNFGVPKLCTNIAELKLVIFNVMFIV